MAEPINLRQARKAKARREKDDASAAARAKHGAPKADRKVRDAAETLAAKRLDGHKRTKD